MNKSNLEKILVDELQYSNYEASLTANDLMQLQPQLIPRTHVCSSNLGVNQTT